MSDFDLVRAATVVDRRHTPRPFNDGFVLIPLRPEGPDLVAQAARIRSQLAMKGVL